MGREHRIASLPSSWKTPPLSPILRLVGRLLLEVLVCKVGQDTAGDYEDVRGRAHATAIRRGLGSDVDGVGRCTRCRVAILCRKTRESQPSPSRTTCLGQGMSFGHDSPRALACRRASFRESRAPRRCVRHLQRLPWHLVRRRPARLPRHHCERVCVSV